MLKGRPAILTVAVVSVLLLILVVAGRDGSQVATAADVAQASTCANGIVVPDPANNPGLVSDCEALLAGQDTLAGTATLNWSADTPIEDWVGVLSMEPHYGSLI